MIEVLCRISDILDIAYIFVCIILYYLSIRKCFLKGKKGGVILFFVTLFTNPTTFYFILMFSIAVLLRLILPIFNIEYNSVFGSVFTMFLLSALYVGFIMLFSNLIGKWLGAYNKRLVAFVSLMFGVMQLLSGRFTLDVSVPGSEFLYISFLVCEIALYAAGAFLYLFVIKALSKLTDKRRELDTGLFVIPPTIFIVFYNVFIILMSVYVDNIMSLFIALFSDIILFLFIWAFYVIIKNINATNEAIEAKDLAAEMARTEALREADLSIAKNIQSSALPSVFPPFPERTDFELFASMNAAKEVGGDFYDFYMIDENTLGFLIADVSGKSIPGAMFMMTSKTVIKSLAESGMPPAEVFTRANEKLCEGNEAEMFVTAWLGFLDLNTGLVHIANAGHNPAVLIHEGKAEYVILKPGLMLAGMDGVRYKEQTVQLEKGDILYLYTDGVTEAMNKDEEQYGEDRLKELLSFGDNYPAPSEKNGVVQPVCDMVTADLAEFTNGAEQSDDITMLCVRYLGGE